MKAAEAAAAKAAKDEQFAQIMKELRHHSTDHATFSSFLVRMCRICTMYSSVVDTVRTLPMQSGSPVSGSRSEYFGTLSVLGFRQFKAYHVPCKNICSTFIKFLT